MIYLAEPNLNGNERKYLNECIDTTFVSSVGKFVTRLEEQVAEITGAGFCAAVSSGTAGLHMALKACGVERDELVCMPAFTFIATANAAAHCGAQPWLIDISRESWTMDPEILEKELKEKAFVKNGRVYHKASGKRVAAVMPVYTLGMPADMDRLNKIAEEYHLPVIADAAAAIGARYKNRNIGKLADATVFSFNGNKTVTSGGGGAIVSADEGLVERARHLSTTARCGMEYDHDMVGYNNRMTNIQAAVGCAQLERVDELVARKRHIREYYFNKLSGMEGIEFFPEAGWAESACWFSGLLLGPGLEVKKICGLLKERGIEARTFWKPIHLQEPYRGSEMSGMSVTDGVWRGVLTLPSSTGITDGQLDCVASAVRDILKPQLTDAAD